MPCRNTNYAQDETFAVKPAFYLVIPRPPFNDMRVFPNNALPVSRMFADLTMVTVASLAPPDIEVSICDEELGAVDFNTAARFIGLTCRMGNEWRVVELANQFRRRGKHVVVGGPGAESGHDMLRPYCDTLVLGELEGIAREFFADLAAGTLKRQYRGPKPDLATSPAPRWDLLAHDRTVSATLQTSRGCPFVCEFCDVPVTLGRIQRFKSSAQVLSELQTLYDLGYRAVSIVDDNLTVNRRRAKALLADIAEWNHSRPDGAVLFSALVSLDAARDKELLDACARAGVVFVFVGIESPNPESLREAKKRQNLFGSIASQIDVILAHGIMVTGGLIVGFDSDERDIFDQQLQFSAQMPVPIFTASILSPLVGTPLFTRMQAEGRLVTVLDVTRNYASPLHPQIVPKNMTHQELVAGHARLVNGLFAPESFGHRLATFVKRFKTSPLSPRFATPDQLRPVERQALHQLVDSYLETTQTLRWWRNETADPTLERLFRLSVFQYLRLIAPRRRSAEATAQAYA
jgi:radical SAM superfamily enzyme YgiQ (UPF0313 family)